MKHIFKETIQHPCFYHQKSICHVIIGVSYRRTLQFLAHLSRRPKGELIVYPCSGVRRRCRCRCCCQPLSNMNISEASRLIAIKFYLKHHWGGGKAAWGFGEDHFRTLVSMATDSSHRVTMGKTTSSRFLECF